MIVDIQKVESVVNYFGLKNKTRKREVVWNRYAMYRFMRNNGFSFEKIGSFVGKDHATVINGLKIYEQNKRYNDFQSYVKEIEFELMSCYENSITETDDTCVNEAICMVNLENLISEKL